MEYRIEQRSPSVKEYNYLRTLVEWPTYDESLAARGLANSLFSVCVLNSHEEIIGMGRIVGDNAIYLHVQDIIVSPQHQKKGIGSMIMKELMLYVDQVGGKNTNIGLMCSKGREDFYAGFGFVKRPNEKFGAGMIQVKA